MRQKTVKGEKLSWAWKYLSFEARLGLFFLRRLPRHHPDRVEAAKSLREYLAPRRPL